MQQYIGFNAGSSEYMIPILNVREIISMPVITALPHLPSYIRGITNLRGSVIPIVNLNRLLGPSQSDDAGNTVIVITSGQITFGIIVNGITGVLKVDESRIEAPENFFSGSMDNIKGVAKLENSLVTLLDTKKLLPLEDISLLEDTIVDMKKSETGDTMELTKEIDTIGGKVYAKEYYQAKEYMEGKFGDGDPRHNIFNMMLDFMDALGSREYQRLDSIIARLVSETDGDLFREIGRVTRRLHDSLNDFKGSLENGLQKMTENDVPNAVDKLQFVITKTEDAANKTMGIVERYFEESGEFEKHVEDLGDSESAAYLTAFKNSLDDDMTAILTAQQFQDITGQTIRKVIDLVNNVEIELIKLIGRFGMTARPEKENADLQAVIDSTMEDRTEGKVNQSDVEALLNEFGF